MVMAIKVNVQGVSADRQFVAMRMPIATKAAPVQKPFQNWRLAASSMGSMLTGSSQARRQADNTSRTAGAAAAV